MKLRHACLGLLALVALTGGCREGGDVGRLVGSIAPPTDPADITVLAVSISQPPPQPGAGAVTVTLNYELNQPGGFVEITIWLYDDDGFLRFEDDELVATTIGEPAALTPGTYTMATSLALTCGGPDGDEVVGLQGTTDEGFVVLFNRDEAEIKAAARQETGGNTPRVSSAIIDMWCE